MNNKTYLALGLGATLGLLTVKCNDRVLHKPSAEIQETRDLGDKSVHNVIGLEPTTQPEITGENDSGENPVEVDMSSYLDNKGRLVRNFNPSPAVSQCIRENSDAIMMPLAAGMIAMVPERISSSENETTFPVVLRNTEWSSSPTDSTPSVYSMLVMSGSGAKEYKFDLDDIDASKRAVEAACWSGLQALEADYSLEEFCTTDPFDINYNAEDPCEENQKSWSYLRALATSQEAEINNLADEVASLDLDLEERDGGIRINGLGATPVDITIGSANIGVSEFIPFVITDGNRKAIYMSKDSALDGLVDRIEASETDGTTED